MIYGFYTALDSPCELRIVAFDFREKSKSTLLSAQAWRSEHINEGIIPQRCSIYKFTSLSFLYQQNCCYIIIFCRILPSRQCLLRTLHLHKVNVNSTDLCTQTTSGFFIVTVFKFISKLCIFGVQLLTSLRNSFG